MYENNTAVKASSSVNLAREILHEIFINRRLIEGQDLLEADFESEFEPHLSKVVSSIENDEPVHMVLPGFPAKSPNRWKTLGHLPDFGEELAFRNINELCERIENIYSNGAKVTVCSDGRVFADIVHIPDEHVSEYNNELREKYKERFNGRIKFFDLDDVYEGSKNFDLLREELMMAYGEPYESLRKRCKTEAEAGVMYKGITRFLFEDYKGLEQFKEMSNTAIQKYARSAAYRVIQRSNAWSRLVAIHLPKTIRLSIHPQFRISEKIGLNLIGDDRWTTPWHSVVLKSNDGYTLMPRHKVEELNVALIFESGRPSHYQLME